MLQKIDVYSFSQKLRLKRKLQDILLVPLEWLNERKGERVKSKQ